MKFFITGGLGFIGSNFIFKLIEKDPSAKIINLDAQFTGSNKKNLLKLKHYKNYEFVKGNINNQKIIDKLVSKCDVVFNFAAESHVDRSISGPKPFIQSNIMGLYTILESIRKYPTKLIQISTDEVFGSLRKGSAIEIDPLNPSNPYAASKAAAEMLVKSYVNTYDSDIVITRCTNNYGPRQFEEKLIPKVIFLALKNKKIPIYGTGKNIRDWIFVDDHTEGIFKAFQKGKKGHSYNFSGSNEVDNIFIVKKILSKLKKSHSLIKYTTDRLGHDFRYSLNSNKSKKDLNWKPIMNFDKGLDLTIDWYKNKLD